VTLQVLAELKAVFKTDDGLELNVSKTSILPKGVTAQDVFDMAQTIMQATPILTHLSNDFLLDSVCPEGFIGIGVPIDTDAFVRSFVAKTCRDIIDDVEKLDPIQDGFIHFQLLRFCQATRLQYINSNIMLSNRCVLQQQHVDCKIADMLLKNGTKQMCFILLLHVLWPGLVLSLRNVRSCGCLKMIFGTRPHGHRHRFLSFVTSIPSFLHSTTARRSVRRLRHRSTQGLVLD
jgi:hypothetical protein